jgi:O-glycosyl hydrolase
MNNHRIGGRYILIILLVIFIVIFTIPVVFATSVVTINGTDSGRIFDGIGMVNSSGTSKLIMDYPANQQADILDFLYKPNFGAGLTIVKNEIGADINSSSGTEPCHQRLQTDTPTARGVNFWICQQAKSRNSAIEFTAGRWGIPAWANASDSNKKDYYINYLNLMVTNGTPLDYLSPDQNENSFSRDYVVNTLKPALNSASYSNLKLVAQDAYQSWGIADTVVSDSDLKSALYAINNHYVTTSTTNAQNCGLPLFNDESDTPFREQWSRLMLVAINNAKQYVDGKMVRVMYQPALDSVYDTLKFNYKGILTANTPWSGHYEIHPSLWMTAHYTQFAKPGWKFLDSGCGSVDSNNYYVTLRNPDTSDYSIIIINSGSTATNYSFTVTGGLSTDTVHVWRTNQTEQFIQQTDITPSDGTFSISIPAQSIYSITTTTGQLKGTPTYTIPADTAFSLPYTDDFSTYTLGSQPKYTYDQSGAFEVANNSGNCLAQVITTKPIEWGGGTTARDPYTVLGDPKWTNYQVSADIKLDTSGSALVSGRGNLHNRDSNVPPSGYQLQLWVSGHWYFRKVIYGTITNFANGTVSGFNATAWHNLKVTMNGSAITAHVDGAQVAATTDTSLSSGQAALGCSFNSVYFDNLKIEPIDTSTAFACTKIDDKNNSITYNGTWTSEDQSWQDYYRTAQKSNTANSYAQYTFTGTCVSLVGRQTANSGKADIYIDGTQQTTIDNYKSSTLYRVPFYRKTGLASGSHTVKVVVSGTKNTSASDYYIYIDSIESSN